MVQYTDSGACYLYDLDSRNGTLVNDRRVATPTPLHHGDRITIGPYTLGFVQETGSTADEEEPPTTDAPGAEQQVTSVVVNIRDYAGLEQRLGKTRAAEIAAALHQESRGILEDMGAWTQKYVGAAILAIWVHRSFKPPLNVVLSAFESVSRIARAAAGFQARFNLDAPVHITAGLETGKTSIASLDSSRSADLAALDDAVNRAFRIDSRVNELDREIAFGASTGEILLQGVALREIAQERRIALNSADAPAPLWLMSMDALSRMLIGMPQRTVRIQLP